MRRVATMLGMVLLLACMAAGVAVADHRFNEINCENRDLPCNGTDGDDLMHERQGTVKDVMYGKGGEDALDANNLHHDPGRPAPAPCAGAPSRTPCTARAAKTSSTPTTSTSTATGSTAALGATRSSPTTA